MRGLIVAVCWSLVLSRGGLALGTGVRFTGVVCYSRLFLSPRVGRPQGMRKLSVYSVDVLCSMQDITDELSSVTGS